MSTKDEQDLETALKFVKQIRFWAMQENVNPWVMRQALLVAFELDTQAALEHVRGDELAEFDNQIKAQAWEIFKKEGKISN